MPKIPCDAPKLSLTPSLLEAVWAATYTAVLAADAPAKLWDTADQLADPTSERLRIASMAADSAVRNLRERSGR